MLKRIFTQLAQEMIDNGFQEIKGTAYYRHPDPLIVSKVTMQHSNAVYEDDYLIGAEGELSAELRLQELTRELIVRFRRGGYKMGYNSWGEPGRYWQDPCSMRGGVRRYLKQQLK